MLGNRGMVGVLMITTRSRGEDKSPMFSVTAQQVFRRRLSCVKPYPRWIYAWLYNEALVNAGRAPLYC